MLNKTFVLAGRAAFVIENPKGESVTVKVTKSKPFVSRSGRTFPPSFFVSVRHQNDAWQYLGFVNPTDPALTITPTFKSVRSAADRVTKIAQWALGLIATETPAPKGYRLAHTGKCGRCGKMLRDETSLARGIGPDCWEMI
tara:strand:- start:3992 stop:4414 length:423 start_codon:yes stop_codon:yes gene_type:complete